MSFRSFAVISVPTAIPLRVKSVSEPQPSVGYSFQQSHKEAPQPLSFQRCAATQSALVSHFSTKSQSSNKPQSLVQKEQPWIRLHEDATLSSSRRHYLHFDPEAPKDSLDLHLKATYDHHQDFLWSKNQTLYQKETFTDDHGLLLKEKPPDCGIENVELRVWTDPHKSSIFSIKGPIGESKL
uniref:Uncharacterized protein n=1 Tax=Scleropages formosus TaxID=113540 RepID=A0A8C9V7S7_SCLFO